MRVWIDIENPPQVQYLLPLHRAFLATGAETILTARDNGSTVTMLERAGVAAHVCGHRSSRSKFDKLRGLGQRVVRLNRFFARSGCPDVLIAASRPAAVAARAMSIPSLIVGDYEYANVSVYRMTGSTILHPEVIDPGAFQQRGMRADQLVAFRGIKEDLTFAGVDLEVVEPHDFGGVPADAVRVLFRPPSETSHYYNRLSTAMAAATLRHLAASGALVVFAPRARGQLGYLDGIAFRREPIVLERPVPFVPLLKSVDAVVCSGGTMLREAAFLGIPAYSIFQSRIGAVDRWLQEIGRAELLSEPSQLARIKLRRRGDLQRLDSNPNVVDEIVAVVSATAGFGAAKPIPQSV